MNLRSIPAIVLAATLANLDPQGKRTATYDVVKQMNRELDGQRVEQRLGPADLSILSW